MEDCCVINNCQNFTSDSSFFKFPFEDHDLLEKWLEIIPKDLYTIIEESSSICEHHFETNYVLVDHGSKNKRLHPEAVPTIFIDSSCNTNEFLEEDRGGRNLNSICRFCLRTLQDEEKQIAISSYIRKQFFVITDTELKSSQSLSQVVCEMCFDSTCDLAKFKTKLLENQQKLEESLVDDDIIVESVELENFPLVEFEDNSNFRVDQIYEDYIEVPKADFYEEHLDLDLIETLVVSDKNHQETEEVELETFETLEKKKKAQKKKLCSDCGKRYSNQAFKRHVERVHLSVKNYHCDYCSYKSYSRSHIEIHIRSHLKIKIFSCEQCGASFGSGNILRQHFLTHQQDRPHVCDHADCQLSFKSVYALRRHQKTHSDNRMKFDCDECNATFIDKWHLKRHKAGHQTQSHPCPICGKIFGTNGRLRSHQVYHRSPQYPCTICHKEFYKRTDLTSHMKTHSGQKDFQCKFCSNSYFKKAHLNRHLASHEQE